MITGQLLSPLKDSLPVQWLGLTLSLSGPGLDP